MNDARRASRGAARGALCALLASCSITAPRETALPTPAPPPTPAPAEPAASSAAASTASSGTFDPFAVPDALPKFEPRSRRGNPPFYDVFGRRYYVMSSSAGYVERGVASWYGPGFHAELTSVGEKYDMYGMTAAHKTLSLPTYVRVTNLQNQRSVIVRVNDRGPFVSTRIIDLSYTAAAKLDMLKNGTAFVEVRAIDPSANPLVGITPVTSAILTGSPAAPSTSSDPATPQGALLKPAMPPPAPTAAPAIPAGAPPIDARPAPPAAAPARALFVQAGAFVRRENAQRLATRLNAGRYGTVSVVEATVASRHVYRVRVGPIANVAAFDRTVKALEGAGIADAQLAPDEP